MIFSELYSAYYNAVAGIIKTAIDHPLQKGELRAIVEKHAFSESVLTIEPALLQQQWQLIEPDGTTIISRVPDMPLTTVQKQWLKAIFADPRIRLFTDDLPDFPDVEPLFTCDDYTVFDKYADGDDFEDETYRRTFRFLMDAIKNRSLIRVTTENHRGRIVKKDLIPEYLEFSEKDDKFRLIAKGKPFEMTINLGRIRSCEVLSEALSEEEIAAWGKSKACEKRSVVFELYDQRKALERVLLHFAHFEKEAERLGEDTYKVTVCYDKSDETEIVIRILSFGPMIRVIEPDSFVELIKERLLKQRSCGL